jgi:hypothetical protein
MRHHHKAHGCNPLFFIGGLLVLLLVITGGNVGWVLVPLCFCCAAPLIFGMFAMAGGWCSDHGDEMRGSWDKFRQQWDEDWKHEWHQHKDEWKQQFFAGWGHHEPEKRKGGYRPDRAEAYGEKPKNRPTYVIGDDGELVEFKDNPPTPKRGDDGYDYV